MTDPITSRQLDGMVLKQSPQTNPGDRYEQQDIDTLLRLASFSLKHHDEEPALTAREIRTAPYGYDKDEIDDLLDRIADTLERIQTDDEDTEGRR